MTINENLIDDYKRCKNIIEEQSKTFSVAFGQLPSPKKEAIWSYYAFNRRLDDLGDEEQSVDMLQVEYKHFRDLLEGRIHDDFIYRTLSDVVQLFPIHVEAVEAMFRGQYKDAKGLMPQNQEELIDYCYEVAGSVGQMLLPILATEGYKNHRKILEESAKNIGIGMQLTNILRDIVEDYKKGRIYLPKNRREEEGVYLDKLIEELRGQPVRKGQLAINRSDLFQSYVKLWKEYANLAVDHYNKGLEYLSYYDKESQVIIYGAARMYSSILQVVANEGYGLLKRSYVPQKDKIRILNDLAKERDVREWKINGWR